MILISCHRLFPLGQFCLRLFPRIAQLSTRLPGVLLCTRLCFLEHLCHLPSLRWGSATCYVFSDCFSWRDRLLHCVPGVWDSVIPVPTGSLKGQSHWFPWTHGVIDFSRDDLVVTYSPWMEGIIICPLDAFPWNDTVSAVTCHGGNVLVSWSSVSSVISYFPWRDSGITNWPSPLRWIGHGPFLLADSVLHCVPWAGSVIDFFSWSHSVINSFPGLNQSSLTLSGGLTQSLTLFPELVWSSVVCLGLRHWLFSLLWFSYHLFPDLKGLITASQKLFLLLMGSFFFAEEISDLTLISCFPWSCSVIDSFSWTNSIICFFLGPTLASTLIPGVT